VLFIEHGVWDLSSGAYSICYNKRSAILLGWEDFQQEISRVVLVILRFISSGALDTVARVYFWTLNSFNVAGGHVV